MIATRNPDFKRCDPEIYKTGIPIFVSTSISSEVFENWVMKVRLLFGQRVDWFFCGDSVVVKYIGDRSRVKAAIEQLLEEHNKLQYDAVLKLSPGVAYFWEPDYKWK